MVTCLSELHLWTLKNYTSVLGKFSFLFVLFLFLFHSVGLATDE